MMRHPGHVLLLAAAALLLGGCSPKIYGTVRFLDERLQPLPAENPEGTVVNMINTTAALENASHAATVDPQGRFASGKGAIAPGLYKVEASRIGFTADTATVEIGRFTRKGIDIQMKKINEGKRRSLESSRSDEDKIVNPGEVNIQPPML